SKEQVDGMFFKSDGPQSRAGDARNSDGEKRRSSGTGIFYNGLMMTTRYTAHHPNLKLRAHPVDSLLTNTIMDR
ncbi:hypothetical protein, partial [Pseudomonas viridiflava]|uniref:hypothetical protein n=1 Tax=Pseudomonas viridiflava TaxID=33069 RepID=UPI001981CC82